LNLARLWPGFITVRPSNPGSFIWFPLFAFYVETLGCGQRSDVMFAALWHRQLRTGVRSLDRAPVIRSFLVVQVPHTSNMRRVTVCFRPIDCRFLSAKSAKPLIALGLDHIVIDSRPFWTALRPRFNVDGCHNLTSFWFAMIPFRNPPSILGRLESCQNICHHSTDVVANLSASVRKPFGLEFSFCGVAPL
jgi:hypothetical protein